jgi:hypothetical protein
MLMEWRYDAVDGFISDLIRILEKYGLMIFMTDFITSKSFPTKNNWKGIVTEAACARKRRVG